MLKRDLLLIEPDPFEAETLRALFRFDNDWLNEVFIVEDASTALRFLRQEAPYQASPRPDLIVLDIDLPNDSSFPLLEAIKQDIFLRLIPVIVLGSAASIEKVHHCYDLYANCFITKPIDPERLHDIIQMTGRFWFSIVKLPPKA